MGLSVEDRVAIMELVSRYNFSIDHFEAEAWADTFAEDGMLIAGGTERAKGRANLIEYVAKRRHAGEPRLRHWVSNFLIDGDAAKAKLKLYVMAFNIAKGLEAPYVMGEYDDDLEKIGSAWKFKVRRMNVVAGASSTGK
jgi:hypothetical protein